ncbi:hypothetical protein ACFVW5_17940 [Streptomyces sp. NPDC058232]|uniref:hypothetical protein n=1 Tax=Streptomyces sp. NPDC058232 TaxID=3346393 RepID=UPI0036E919FB
MADCLHQLDLCPDCDGLRTVTLHRLHGVTSVTLDSDSSTLSLKGPAHVSISPADPGACPNAADGAGRG